MSNFHLKAILKNVIIDQDGGVVAQW